MSAIQRIGFSPHDIGCSDLPCANANLVGQCQGLLLERKGDDDAINIGGVLQPSHGHVKGRRLHVPGYQHRILAGLRDARVVDGRRAGMGDRIADNRINPRSAIDRRHLQRAPT
jgi:hypothetical protein